MSFPKIHHRAKTTDEIRTDFQLKGEHEHHKITVSEHSVQITSNRNTVCLSKEDFEAVAKLGNEMIARWSDIDIVLKVAKAK